ncbi:hypothetical protein ACE3NQ_14800 [Paenibacillus terreus]|uniref:Uncharacterized protein n=1 Tax=Paenibacillus terreus TaxID=1387834 RepID=A0ABV5B919_9BACL
MSPRIAAGNEPPHVNAHPFPLLSKEPYVRLAAVYYAQAAAKPIILYILMPSQSQSP